MTTMTPGEIFLAGMVARALLALMVAVAVWIRPKPRRRGIDEQMQRALDESYQAGRVRGREEATRPLPPRATQVLRVVPRGRGGWIGTTAQGGKEPA